MVATSCLIGILHKGNYLFGGFLEGTRFGMVVTSFPAKGVWYGTFCLCESVGKPMFSLSGFLISLWYHIDYANRYFGAKRRSKWERNHAPNIAPKPKIWALINALHAAYADV